MPSLIEIRDVSKVYANGLKALDGVSLDVREGEILGLLGANGAGKSTLIGIVCGLVNLTSGRVSVNGYDVRKDYRKSRQMVGLVPQELTTDAFETVWNTVSFSRGLFNKPHDPAHLEKVLRSLSLWDKRDSQIMTLSGGMKRRVLIAKALSHEPKVLFLDEPTAGVDVELRKSMWDLVRDLRREGVTIILTTHYLNEAEEIAERVAVIKEGRILMVEEKSSMMRRLGTRRLVMHLNHTADTLPPTLANKGFELLDTGSRLVFLFNDQMDQRQTQEVLSMVSDAGLAFSDFETEQSSLEDIFVNLLNDRTPS